MRILTLCCLMVACAPADEQVVQTDTVWCYDVAPAENMEDVKVFETPPVIISAWRCAEGSAIGLYCDGIEPTLIRWNDQRLDFYGVCTEDADTAYVQYSWIAGG